MAYHIAVRFGDMPITQKGNTTVTITAKDIKEGDVVKTLEGSATITHVDPWGDIVRFIVVDQWGRRGYIGHVPQTNPFQVIGGQGR